MSALEFRVTGIPGAQGSKNVNRYGATYESSKKVKPWRSDVKAAAEQAIADAGDWAILTGPTWVIITFNIRRPRAHYGTGRNADVVKATAPRYVTSRSAGDLDKLERSTLDALVAAGVMADDSLVALLAASKLYVDGAPGALIQVRSLDEEAVA